MERITDKWGREVNYLRLSVTDRCNMRCLYCVPKGGIKPVDRNLILSYEEILQIIKPAVSMGINRIRITGGEPLVRKGICSLVGQLSSLVGVSEVSLTTNGLLLGRKAELLARNGLSRVNVSLDSLNPNRFSYITRGGEFNRVFAGILAAEAAKLTPVKLNVVVMRGINYREIPNFVRLTLNHQWHVRFIEYMPVGSFVEKLDWSKRFVSINEIKEIIEGKGWKLLPAYAPVGGGPAKYFRIEGALGKVGFISPMTHKFCDQCNRLRVTPDGRIRACLLDGGEINVKRILRSGGDEEQIKKAWRKALNLKPRAHAQTIPPASDARDMVFLGG